VTTPAFFSLIVAPLLAAAAPAGPMQELHYSGSLSPLTRDGEGAAVKEFTVDCLLDRDSDGGTNVGYLIDERGGGGGWPWPERFGRIRLDSQNRPTSGSKPQVLHRHNETPHPLPLPQPLFEHMGRLAAGAEWSVENDRFHVRGRQRVGERECWQVEVAGNARSGETLFVDVKSGIIVAGERQIFMGRGDEFVLKLRLDSDKQLTPEESERFRRPLKSLLALKEELKRPANDTNPDLTGAQLKSASAVLERLDAEAADTPFARLAGVIARDVKAQRDRTENLAGLAEKFVGRKSPDFELKRLDSTPIARDEHAGKIAVLHFWDYRNEPLVEPYGQVGYLDFVHSRRSMLGVKIVGVAVDERLASAEKRPAALRQIRGVLDFMRPGYTIAADDGALLAKFGDPRRLGAKLPLWVVIDSDGQVAHYRAGFYELKPDEGLRELDDVLMRLLEKKRSQTP
jgi:hypothetical protein